MKNSMNQMVNGTQGMTTDPEVRRIASIFRRTDMKSKGYVCKMIPGRDNGPHYSPTPTIYEVRRPDGGVIAEGRTARDAWAKAEARY
jgi:hypothetical protein